MDARNPPWGVTGIYSPATINQPSKAGHSPPCKTDNWFDIQMEGNSNSTAKFRTRGIIQDFGRKSFLLGFSSIVFETDSTMI